MRFFKKEKTIPSDKPVGKVSVWWHDVLFFLFWTGVLFASMGFGTLPYFTVAYSLATALYIRRFLTRALERLEREDRANRDALLKTFGAVLYIPFIRFAFFLPLPWVFNWGFWDVAVRSSDLSELVSMHYYVFDWLEAIGINLDHVYPLKYNLRNFSTTWVDVRVLYLMGSLFTLWFFLFFFALLCMRTFAKLAVLRPPDVLRPIELIMILVAIAASILLAIVCNYDTFDFYDDRIHSRLYYFEKARTYIIQIVSPSFCTMLSLFFLHAFYATFCNFFLNLMKGKQR